MLFDVSFFGGEERESGTKRFSRMRQTFLHFAAFIGADEIVQIVDGTLIGFAFVGVANQKTAFIAINGFHMGRVCFEPTRQSVKVLMLR